jgi:thiosulfate dehydrogenase [quinone] large subunit
MPRIAEWRNSVDDPPITQALFSDTRLSWLWLFVRLYMGYSWISSGLGKLANTEWTVTGNSLKTFWVSAVAIPATGKPPITFDWYRDFLTFMLNGGHYVWFAKLVVAGELLIGTAMILGAFVGVAALAGGFMNWNFMMAGSASVNPVLFLLSVLLIMAWKTAGYIGVDRVLLPILGTPWRPGIVFVRSGTPQLEVAGGSGEPLNE